MRGPETAAQSGPELRILSGERPRTVSVGAGVAFGAGTPVMIAGPCAVEDFDSLYAIARAVKASGASVLRGGAAKPRTSPWSFPGLGAEGLRMLAEVRRLLGMPVVTELLDARDLDAVRESADIIQIGARNMQNFALLHAVGSVDKPVLLKRGLGATYEEWAYAAEHIAKFGNLDIILCERGIRTFESYTRNTLDLAAVPVMQAMTGLPVVVDPSHATGRPELIAPLSRAAVAAGCDGLMIEVHQHPAQAKCDGAQALLPEEYDGLCRQLDDRARRART